MISLLGTACFANPFTDVLKQLNASDDKQEIATTNEPTDEFTSAQIGALLSVCPGNDNPPLLAFVSSTDTSFPASNAMAVFLSALSSLAADTTTITVQFAKVLPLLTCLLVFQCLFPLKICYHQY